MGGRWLLPQETLSGTIWQLCSFTLELDNKFIREICRRNLVGRGQQQELGKPLLDIMAWSTLEGGANVLQRGANHALWLDVGQSP